MFDFLFSTKNWPPRWKCGTWTDALGYTHIISDLMIWGAYMAIPLILIYFVRKRKDFPFHAVFLLFAAFIILCGFTHLNEAIIFYYPFYRWAGLLKAVTAVISWATVFALIPVVPKLTGLPALSQMNELLNKNLKETRERLEIAFEGVKEGLWDWDIGQNQVTCSAFLAQMLKIGNEDVSMPHTEFFDFIHFEDKEKVRNLIHHRIEDRGFYKESLRILPKEKEQIWVNAIWKGIFDEQGNLSRIIGSFHSADADKKNEKSLERTQKTIEDLQKDLASTHQSFKELNSTLLKHVKTPIASLEQSMQAILSKKEALPQQESQALESALQQCSHIESFLTQLQTFSSVLEAEFFSQKCNLQELAEKTLATLKPLLEKEKARLHYINPLPEATCDPRYLSLVFTMLVENAIQYNQASEKRIEIGAKEEEKQWVIFIKDNGIGIAHENLEAVFTPFKSINTSTDATKAGLGLTTAKKIVEKHGGRIWVESKVGEGSTFFFSLTKAKR